MVLPGHVRLGKDGGEKAEYLLDGSESLIFVKLIHPIVFIARA